MTRIKQPAERLDARKKLNGEAEYLDDISFDNLYHACVLRSPHAHARIKTIDTTQAEKMAEVETVITGKDVSSYIVGMEIGDQRPLALDKVRYKGEPVAVAVASDKWKADQALEEIEVEYEELESVVDAQKAFEENSPLIHENQKEYEREGVIDYKENSNIFSHYKLRKGNVDQAFAQADLIVKNTYTYPHRAHAQLETHGAVARWNKGDKLEIYSSTQSPFFIRNSLAEMLGLDGKDIQVKTGYLGGGFGGKSDITIEPLTALIAKFVPNKYVKLKLSREEAFMGSVLGRGVTIEMKTAVTREGEILGEKNKLYFDSGAYGSYSLHIVTAAGHNSSGPYEIDNIKVDSYGVYTNNPPVGAFRGYGHPEVHWAKERQINIIAKKLNLVPYQVRKKNLLRPGSINALGQEIEEENGDLESCVRKVKEKLDDFQIKSTVSNKIYGKGMAAIMKSPVMATNSASSAIIRFNEEGTVDVACSGVEMGQGTKTAMKQIAATALKLPLDKIKIKEDIDTEISPYGWQTIGSTTTWKSGMAVLDAAEKAIVKIKDNASKVLKISKEDLKYDGEYVFDKNDKNNRVMVDEVVFGYMYDNGLVVGEPVQTYGTYMPPDLTYPDPETGQGNCAADWTFGAQGAVVEIDKTTGMVSILKLITVMDAGKIINPTLARNQVVGAMVQEMGGALTESIIYSKDGKMRNNNFTDFKIPTPADSRKIDFEVEFLETPEPIGPFGARGIAEHGTVGIAAAIGNAISNAASIEFKDLPMIPERVYLKLQKEGDLHV